LNTKQLLAVSKGARARWAPTLLLLAAALLAPPHPLAAESRGSVGVEGKQFVVNGKPLQIISGEMHYARIPRAYWRDRLKKARAMGLNTISTYVFWNIHEPSPGQYDFTGEHDVSAFIRVAQEEGLYVILRPGPYVCAEWDLGGYPAWLLADPTIVLRSTDEKFMRPAEEWLQRLGKELAPLQITRGGPIIAVQVENEYGSFDRDKEYLGRIREALVKAGLGEALLYTADGADELAAGTLPDLPAAVNFGPGEAKKEFAKLEKFRPGQPLMSGEYWAGWFDHWGRKHHVTDLAEQARELDWILAQGYSVNLYMFHGGTSFGFMNGANNDEGGYWPDTTSYDYDAALDEAGRPTKKFAAFREVISRHRPGETLPELPAPAPIIAVPEFELKEVAPLWSNLGKARVAEKPQSMESLGQSYGYILYRAQVKGPASGELLIRQLRDYSRLYLDGKQIGVLDRHLKQDHMPIKLPEGPHQIDILVENSGRINFTKALRDERKGITQSVTLAGHELTGWEIYPLGMADLSSLQFSSADRSAAAGPAFYRGEFRLDEAGDSFLDMRGWGKGTVWVNGHHLGRFWSIGPQQTLYVPAPWLKTGVNEITVFAWDDDPGPKLKGLREPVLDDLRLPAAPDTEQ